MPEIVKQVLISLCSSGVIVAAVAFIAKNYCDRYIEFYFKKKLSLDEMQQKTLAELKKEFCSKSLEVYEQTSKLSYQCLLEGRKVVNLKKLFDVVSALQAYFENQSYIDQMDFDKIHQYKDNLQLFLGECLGYSAAKFKNESQRLEKQAFLISFWQDNIEAQYDDLRNIFRLFSVKASA